MKLKYKNRDSLKNAIAGIFANEQLSFKIINSEIGIVENSGQIKKYDIILNLKSLPKSPLFVILNSMM